MFLHKWIIRHLSTKLVLTILLLLVLSITLISSLYYQLSTLMMSDHVRASTQQSVKQSADYLSIILTVGSDMGQQVFRDAGLQDVLSEEAARPVSVDRKFDHKEKVNGLLNNLIDTSSFVQSVYLLRAQGSSWGSGLFNVSKVSRYTLMDHDWYVDIMNDRVNELWQPLHYDPFSGGGENNALALSYIRPLRHLETGGTVGAIVINLDGNLILQAIERIRLGETGRFFITDPSGTVMIGSDSSAWGNSVGPEMARHAVGSTDGGEFEFDIDGVRTYVVARKMDNGWTVIGSVPVEEVIGGIQRLQLEIGLYAAVLLAGASLIGFLFSRKITSPLKRLMRQMSELERSNFEAVIEVRSQDEIGQLSRRFNQMVRQIKMLIEQVNAEETKKREAEIRALRHQINPHFLYNTLASIRWMVKYNRTDGAFKGISALVQLMEASMGKKGAFCSLAEEIALLEKFMMIQQYRYGEHIRLTTDCDPGLLEESIPRMLLQPIVENAAFHGIAPKEEGGTIAVVIRRERRETGDMLVMTVEDDGVGMSAETKESLFAGSGERKGWSGIGLHHVKETIQLYYGGASGMTIASEEGRGTRVRLELAMKAGVRHAV
ncbi:sensor histidine kinase [Paenibacillaceae bacterium WGS1546]|uniref:cache domain-containing sensor histidine kinase n=1 Tax=Cohnella sp. WGS1546 TaxID=3366810 RepID=UPI00372D518C